MTGSVRALRLNTVELLRQPGTTREVEVVVATADLGVDDGRVVGNTVAADLRATSTVDGIVIDGQVVVVWADECRRCLVDVRRTVAVEVDELYQQAITDPDAFELGPTALDLTPIVRDGTMLALAEPPPLCRDDCAGICPVCGTDRNVSACTCDVTIRDERWAALDDLQTDD